jgi:2-dehydropantoate 2-reductase
MESRSGEQRQNPLAIRGAKESIMKVLILGAGAIGGYLGGRLQQAGADVTFLVRQARGAALERDGLVIKSTKGDVTQKVKTVGSGSDGGPYDLVVLSNKAYDLDSALDAVAPAIGANTAVMPQLNGMRHVDILAQRFGEARIVGGAARSPTKAKCSTPARWPSSPLANWAARRHGRRWSSSTRRSRRRASMAAFTPTLPRICRTSGSCSAPSPRCAACCAARRAT